MTNMSFEWQIDEFMIYCQSKQLRPKTMQSYEQALRLFARWCEEERHIEAVDKVKEADIRRYINDIQQRGKYTFYTKDSQKQINCPDRRRDFRQQVSNTTINNYLRNLNVFFVWLDTQDSIDKRIMISYNTSNKGGSYYNESFNLDRMHFINFSHCCGFRVHWGKTWRYPYSAFIRGYDLGCSLTM